MSLSLKGTVYTFAVSILIFAAWPDAETASPRPTAVMKQVDHGEQHRKRASFIKEAIASGLFSKVTSAPDKYTHVWVTSRFYALDFDSKSLLINNVHQHKQTEDPGHDMIFLNDNMTGKRIGKYSSFYGLDLD